MRPFKVFQTVFTRVYLHTLSLEISTQSTLRLRGTRVLLSTPMKIHPGIFALVYNFLAILIQ